MWSRTLRAPLALGVGAMLVLSGCEVPDDAPAELVPGDATQADDVSTLIETWQDDICRILDPDPIAEQMGIESYSESGPHGLGLDESPRIGAVKCVASFHLGEYGGASRGGAVYLAVSPNGSNEGAKAHYDDLHQEVAAVLRETVDQTPSWVLANRDLEPEEGPWAEGAIFALIPITGQTWFEGLYWDESYTVAIRVEWDEDTSSTSSSRA